MDMRQKTKWGMVWNVIEKIAVQFISFILNIFLARLLTPEDYGTIGLITIFLTFSNVFVDSGFSRALIQKQDKQEEDYSTVLIFNIIVSAFLYILLFFSSPFIAKLYKTPQLITLQRVFFILIIFNSLTVVQSAKLQAKVDFKTIAIISSITSLISGIIGIIAAYKGLGPWALVLQSLTRTFLVVVLYWVNGKWFPKTGFSWESFKKLFGFGSKLLVSGLLATTLTNIENLFIGKIYNSESLGYYSRAQQFPELTSGTLSGVLNNATFPLLSSLQNDQEGLKDTFKRLIRITSMFVYPSMVGLAILSKPIVLLLLGDKWFFSSELLFWLALSYIFTPLSILNMNILNAIGRSDLFLKADLCKVPIIIFTMILTFPISIKAVVIGKLVCAFIYFYINSFMIGRMYSFGAFKQVACSWKYILSTLFMSFCVKFIDYFVESNLLSVVLGIISGVIVYGLCLFLLKDSEFICFLFKIFRKKSNE